MLNFLQSRCGSCLKIELVKVDVDKSCHLFDVYLSCDLFNRLHQRIFLCSVSSAQRRPSRTWATLGIGPGNVQCDVIGRLLYVCTWSIQKKKVIVIVHITLVLLEPWDIPDFDPFQRFSSFRPHCLTLTSLLFSLLSSICSLLGHVSEMWERWILEPGD